MLILFITTCTYAQDQFPAYSPIYKDDVVGRVHITIPTDSLYIILAPGNEESEYHFHATFMFDNGTIRDTFEDAGFLLRGNTSRYSKKKSFQVSLNTYAPGRTWYGVEKINLNGEHNDPTISRSKIAWDLLRDIGVPAPRSSHVQLYINGEYYGLYANVEHIDEEFVQTRFGNKDGNLFKCLWPADMDYLGSNPDLYKLTSGGRRVYELKTNEEKDDYTDLAMLIDILNNTSIDDLPCELENIFNVNSFLKVIAFDILTGNWDGALYNKNNFYLYHNQATGLFEYIPYDLDNTFGIDWFNIDWANRNIYTWGHPGEPRPLYWRILEVQDYRDRISYYLNTFIHDHYKEDVLFPQIDDLETMITPSVLTDLYYTLDYGFTVNDFHNGFSQELPFFHTPIGVKQFISTRRSATLQQLQLNAIDPIISMVSMQPRVLNNENSIRAYVEDDQGISSVIAHIRWNGTEPAELLTMYDDGEHSDHDPNDGWYGVLLPSTDTAVILYYSIQALDISGHESLNPVCGTYQVTLGSSAITLAINEFMASNVANAQDEFGEYDDWVELYNYGTESIYLGDYYLSDKNNDPTKWSLPDQSIEPGQYLLIWADEDSEQGPLHANFKLSAGGEFVGIFDSDVNSNVLIDGLDFGSQEEDAAYGRYPDGTGLFSPLFPTPGRSNQLISSIGEVHDLNVFSLYPNPMESVLVIQTKLSDTHPEYIILYNVLGQVIAQKAWQPILTFDTAHLPEGIYLIASRGNNYFQWIGKVIK